MPILREINKSFFKTWSPQMAYILGLFTADGNMIRNRRGAHFIEFLSTDEDIIIKIRNSLKSNHKISLRKQKSIKWKDCYRLQIGSKEIYQDLLDLGLSPNKSKTIELPVVPSQYLHHFVRGYFDGDGNVTISNYVRAARKGKIYTIILSGFISGSKKFLEQLHEALKKFASIKGGTLYYHGGAYRLYFSSKDSHALYKFLYKNSGNLHLERKRVKFESYFMGR